VGVVGVTLQGQRAEVREGSVVLYRVEAAVDLEGHNDLDNGF
jgi:hypothetical protein